MLLDEFTEKRGGVLAELAIVWTECGVKVGVDVEFTDDIAVHENGNDDFGFGFEGAGEIARVGVNVVDDDGFAGGGRGAADSLMKRDAGVGRHGALEGAKDEDVAIRFFFQHVKADPVVARELFVEERDDGFHEGVGRRRGFGESVESWNEVGGFRMCGGHGDSRAQVGGRGQLGADGGGKLTGPPVAATALLVSCPENIFKKCGVFRG